ncbi:MAG: uroporphyrinogen-III synthase [Pikeienuella sp.]
MLITRPLPDSRTLAETLEEEGIACEIWPLTAVRPLAMRLTLPPTLDGLLFTSAHGARAFAALSERRDLPAFCVGQATATVARGLGFASAVAAGGDVQKLAALASLTGLRHFLHARGRDAAGDLAGDLANRGVRVSEAVLYAAEETGPAPAPVAHALATGRISLVTLWSARNAEIFARRIAAPGLLAPGLAALAISPAAARALHGLPFAALHVAQSPSAAAMRAAIRRLV